MLYRVVYVTVTKDTMELCCSVSHCVCVSAFVSAVKVMHHIQCWLVMCKYTTSSIGIIDGINN